MSATTPILITTAAVSALFLGALRCRAGHPGLKALQGHGYAHRGLHGNGVPENSMKAFRLALEHGYGIELDIHLMKDGNLAVIHDASLKRTAGVDVLIEDLTTEDLSNYRLEGTEEQIPTFRQVLDLYAGNAPLIIELKAERNNHAALTEAACKAMEGYEGPWCMESFDPRCVLWLKKNRPDVIRGQLTENFVKRKNNLPGYLKFALTHLLTNILCTPDFVSYKFEDRNDSISTWLCLNLWKARKVTWTIRSLEDYNTAVKEGWLPIFEYFKP